MVDGRRVIVGSPAFVEARGARAAELFAPPRHAHSGAVAVDGVIVASAGFGDPVRVPMPGARSTTLRERGWNVGILSGDHPEVVASVGAGVRHGSRGVHRRRGRRRKSVASSSRPRRAGTVVMVGDGVNDAAAIAAASVGVGVHGGAEACLSTADVYLGETRSRRRS